MAFTLYDYFRSSASYRVRIALNLKQLDHACMPVSLLNNEQYSSEYQAINPSGLVPTLQQHQTLLHQSLAIIEYLDECYPAPYLLPRNLIKRAQCRSFALSIACDIHPLNNLRVLKQLEQQFDCTSAQKTYWYHHWLQQGFTALEQQLQQSPYTEHFCFGAHPTLADICLIPQVYNAKRFEFDLSPFPTIATIYHHCEQLEPFTKAAPES
ncbi:maleylacetoacetate isomerase [Photobacterium leiognathi]|uniref:maleylacetoacetate isomerase n=1 Tax=Photobacterium leiognathi TaxID=553611 RepID=UPI00273A37AB|nr:maleylacetoacetate isomerase [Photobacterium leiognathi]